MSVVINQALKLIASASKVNANTLADHVLAFEPGIDLNNYVGVVAVAKYQTGTLAPAQIIIKNVAGINSNLETFDLSSVTLGNDVTTMLTGAWKRLGVITCEVSLIALLPASFDILVFGIPR